MNWYKNTVKLIQPATRQRHFAQYYMCVCVCVYYENDPIQQKKSNTSSNNNKTK